MHARRMLTIGLIALGGLLVVGCGLIGADRGVVYSATYQMRIDRDLPPGPARRQAIADAEHGARLALRDQIMSWQVSQGVRVEQLYDRDPFVRAVVDDAALRAQISDRTISDDGRVSVTVEVDQAPIERMIAGHLEP